MSWISPTIKQSQVIMPSSQGHYANLRNRFLQNDIDGFLDYEVIKLLLKLADNRHDHLIIAGNEITSLGDKGLL